MAGVRSRPRVVIVGSGFGGLQAARSFAGEAVDVVLVDRNNYHAFWPLLYQVGAGQVEPGDVAHPIRSILGRTKNVRFVLMDVARIDRERKVVVGNGPELPYDRLILAVGSRTSFFGIPGAAEHTLPLKSLDDALAIRNRLLERFERSVTCGDPEDRRRALAFLLVGGGPTGVELAGTLAELVRHTFPRDYPTLDMGDVQIVILEAMDRLLPGFGERAQRYARRRLEKLGVTVRVGAKVEEVKRRRIQLAGGETLLADTVIWTAGVEGHPLARESGFSTTKKGTVPVDPFLRAKEDPAVYVIGDLAHFETDEGAPLPMLAQVAMQQGRHVARNVLRDLEGAALEPFSYTDHGIMAAIGRGSAVVERKPISFTGPLAWVVWALVHIGRLVGFRNRLVVMVNWASSYLFSRPGDRLILPREEPPAVGDFPTPGSTTAGRRGGG